MKAEGVTRFTTMLSSKRPSSLIVRQVMSQNPVTIEADAYVSQAWDLMTERHIWHLPVVDHGRLVGLLSERQIRDAMPSVVLLKDAASRRKALAVTRVHQVWLPNPSTIGPDESLVQLIGRMRELRAGCLPVVEHDRLLGVVTAGDLLNLLEALLSHGGDR